MSSCVSSYVSVFPLHPTPQDELRSCQAKNFLRSNQFECRHLLDQYFWLTNRHNLYARFTQLNRGVRPLPLPPGREDEWA